jgi:glycosidase
MTKFLSNFRKTLAKFGFKMAETGDEDFSVNRGHRNLRDTSKFFILLHCVIEYLEHTRDPVRTPLQWDGTLNAGFSDNETGTWLPVHKNYKELNLEAQKKDSSSTFNLYKRLISLRKTNKALQDGAYEGKAIGESVFAFVRYIGNEAIYVAINLKNENHKVNLTELRFTDRNGTVLVGTNKSGFKLNQVVNLTTVELPAYQAVAFHVGGAGSLTILSFLMIFAVIFLRFFN